MGLSADYLVVGAGTSGLAFVDALVGASRADVLIVDRREGPGGHWNVAYPFVRLHQPSAYYGVTSRPLGGDAIDADGPNAGFYERATGAEVLDYLRASLDALVSTGRVRFFGGVDYVGDWAGRHALRRADGSVEEVDVRRRVVDARYLEGSVPATSPPAFATEGSGVVAPNDLPGLDRSAGVTVLGSGKTAMDTVQWMLEAGDDPDSITWVRPRDLWLVNRRYVQPLDLVGWTLEGQARWTESVADATGFADLMARLEASEQLLRLDRSVHPTMFRGAISHDTEVAVVAEVEHVVRAGHAVRVDADEVLLERGRVARAPGDVVVNCTAAGLAAPPLTPVFAGPRITVQPLRPFAPSLNAAITGFVESLDVEDDARNHLCAPDAYPSTDVDWLRCYASNGRTLSRWGRDPRVGEWLGACRLNMVKGALDRAGDPMVADAVARIVARGADARANGQRILAEVGAEPAI